MGKVGVLGLIVLVVLLVSPAASDAIWSGKKQPATAGEAAKEYAKEAVRNTADAAANVGESIKQTANAAYETTANAAKTVTGGRSDRASDGPTGAAYRDRSGNYVADTAAATQRKAAEAAAAVKDTAAGTAQAARDTGARAYDATADTVGSAKDRVWGAPEPEPTYTQRAADAARRASENVRDGASRAYDTTTGGWGSGNEDNRGVYDKARDTVSRAGQATRDTTYRAMGYEAPAEKSYASRAYDSVRGTSADAYETGKNRLGSIIEILGWYRAPDQDEHMTSHLGKYYSPYDVVVGNTRYVWHQKPDEPESYYESAKNTVGSATQTVADKAREGANTVYDAAGRTKDMTVESASRASESVKDVAGKTGETVSEYSQKGKEAINATAAAVEEKLAKPGFFRRLWRFLHLLTWGVTFGTAVWMTFMSGRVLQQNMPREQFRTVQTKMFPSYLRFLTAGEGVLAFLYTFMSRSSKWQILNLLILVGTTAYNAYVLEPQTTKIYLDRLRLEKEEGRGLSDAAADNVNEELAEKNKKFKELHGYSASLNLLSLAGLTYHAWNIVSRLHA
jgi:hypothetical protein